MRRARSALPLIGTVGRAGSTTAQLAGAIAGRLKSGFIRDPSVAVEIETYRPFFVLGEVTFPGQYPYVPNMTVENAIAIAGGFTPRAYKDKVTITRKSQGVPARTTLPLRYPMRPGDTIDSLRTLVLIPPPLVLGCSLPPKGRAFMRAVRFCRPAARSGLRLRCPALRRRQISDPADQVRRRLSGRRAERHHRPHLLRLAATASRPALRGREQGRPGRHDRARPR